MTTFRSSRCCTPKRCTPRRSSRRSAMPTLSQTQALLWKLITAPEGATAGLAALSPREQAVCASVVRADERLSAIERLDIYADMYFYRIRDALKEDFAAVAAVI